MQYVIDCIAQHAEKRIEQMLKKGWFVVSLTSYGMDNRWMIIVFERGCAYGKDKS